MYIHTHTILDPRVTASVDSRASSFRRVWVESVCNLSNISQQVEKSPLPLGQ